MSTRPHPFAAAVVGAVVLAGGWTLARGVLPEWRAGELPDRDRAVALAREVAEPAGLAVSGSPRLGLETVGGRTLGAAYESLGGAAPAALAGAGLGLSLMVSRPASWAGGPPGTTTIRLSARGEPIAATWVPDSLDEFFGVGTEVDPEPVAAELRRRLLRPGESFGPTAETRIMNTSITLLPVVGSDPPAVVVHQRPPGATTTEQRWIGSVEAVRDNLEQLGFRRLMLRGLVPALVFAAVAVLFVALLGRRRLDVRNGLVLALAALATTAASALLSAYEPVELLFAVIYAVILALWVLFAWSVAESLTRSTLPAFGTSLDSLSRLRLGPRGGRGLLHGWAAGAALAGATLAAWALAARWPGLAPREASVGLPAFAAADNPLIVGPSRAALALLALAAAVRLLPPRWRVPAAALAAGLLITPIPFEPVLARRVAGVLFALALLAIFRRWGLTALLTAAVVAAALPPALLAVQHPGWLVLTLLGAGGLVIAVPAIGAAGLRRPAEVETAAQDGPAFVRRIEEERRLQYEMDLLARIQLGLLPGELPALPGYRIAARSTLATEVGGDLYDFFRDERDHLWVAAGDVSGHGYSCAISHAMVKSALVSLIGAEKTPSEILRRIDRVLRVGASTRQFTSLALLKLDPETGRGLFANAGHPYPLLLAGDGAEEVAAPGLPLGQGPARSYHDRPVELPPGGALLFFSDGLVEALDARGAAYGFQRPGVVARGSGGAGSAWDADAILEDVLADWKRWVGGGQISDDTTVIVICRDPAAA